MSPGELRIGDAEREQATSALGEHLAQGRLDLEEHHERLDRVWAARTRAELEPVFADLPAPGPTHLARPAPYVAPTQPYAARAGRRDRAGRSGRARRHPHLLPVAMIVLVGLTILTHLPFLLLGLVGVLAWSGVHRRAGWSRDGHVSSTRWP